MHLVPTLVDGRPFPGCRPAVDHSARKAPIALRGDPSLGQGLELPAGAMWARNPVLSVGVGEGKGFAREQKNSGTLRQNGSTPQLGEGLTRELLTPWSQFAQRSPGPVT